jgi:hypothetical protein
MRAAKARIVAHHIQGLVRIVNGPLASALRKVVITYIMLLVLYDTKA